MVIVRPYFKIDPDKISFEITANVLVLCSGVLQGAMGLALIHGFHL